MPRVAVLDDYQRVALDCADWSVLPTGVEVEVFQDHLADEQALARCLEPFEVVVAMRERTPFPRSLLERLPRLELLITTGRFNAAIDMEAVQELGVTLSGTGGLLYPTAELTWALILGLVRRLPREDAAIRAGAWQVTLGEGLQGKVLGVIGLGNLGSQVAKVGQAFGMEVLAWSQRLDGERAAARGVEAVTRDELLRRSDIVSIHYVLSERSRGLIGAEELALMKPTAYLVNTSRGPLVDEPALIAALEEERIAGAGLDVFDVEPLPPDHAFRRLDNVVVTPHIGYVTKETYAVFFREIVGDIQAYLDGAPVRVVEPR